MCFFNSLLVSVVESIMFSSFRFSEYFLVVASLFVYLGCSHLQKTRKVCNAFRKLYYLFYVYEKVRFWYCLLTVRF